MNGWISVDERLPEAGTEVIVAYGNKLMQAFRPFGPLWMFAAGGTYNSATNRIAIDGDEWEICGKGVTHWMPMPEPPTETKPMTIGEKILAGGVEGLARWITSFTIPLVDIVRMSIYPAVATKM